MLSVRVPANASHQSLVVDRLNDCRVFLCSVRPEGLHQRPRSAQLHYHMRGLTCADRVVTMTES
eukprot:1125026-Rhodomonas_salina.1